MACALAPTPEVPTRAQRSQSAEARPPCPAPAPLKVKLKIKIGGKVTDKKGEPTALDDHARRCPVSCSPRPWCVGSAPSLTWVCRSPSCSQTLHTGRCLSYSGYAQHLPPPARLCTKCPDIAAAVHAPGMPDTLVRIWPSPPSRLHAACAKCAGNLQSASRCSAARQLGKSSPPSCLQSGLHSPRGRQGPLPRPPPLSHNQNQLSLARSSTNSLGGHLSSLQLPWAPQQALPGSSSHRLSFRVSLRPPHSQARPMCEISSLRLSRLCWVPRGAGGAQASWLAQRQPGRRWTVTCPRGRGPAFQLGTSRTSRWQPVHGALVEHCHGHSLVQARTLVTVPTVTAALPASLHLQQSIYSKTC